MFTTWSITQAQVDEAVEAPQLNDLPRNRDENHSQRIGWFMDLTEVLCNFFRCSP
jgi:hypothetical protein